MSQIESAFMVSGDKEVIEAIKARVEQLSRNPTSVSERKNLDGSVSAWVLASTLAIQALPIILNFVKDYAASKRVKKIKVGDIEIENPDEGMIEAMKKKLANG